MFLGVVGFAMIVIIVAALIRSKSNPVPLFVIVHGSSVHFLHRLLLHDGGYGSFRSDG